MLLNIILVKINIIKSKEKYYIIKIFLLFQFICLSLKHSKFFIKKYFQRFDCQINI